MSALDTWYQTWGQAPPASAARGSTEASENVAAKATASVDEYLMMRFEREWSGSKLDEREY